MQDMETRRPAKTGYYPLKKGGMLVASNVPIPDITPDMLIWWSSIYPADPLLYAIWEPEDHYDAQMDEVAKKRLLDPDVPGVQKLWGGTHTGTEDMGTVAGPGELHFADPADMGFDSSIIGTKECPYLYCANTVMTAGPMQVPIFLMETYCYDEEGKAELRFRAWVGYTLKNGEVKCKLPKFMKIPDAVPQGIIQHNFKEFGHLNKVLPLMYQEKDAITAEATANL